MGLRTTLDVNILPCYLCYLYGLVDSEYLAKPEEGDLWCLGCPCVLREGFLPIINLRAKLTPKATLSLGHVLDHHIAMTHLTDS